MPSSIFNLPNDHLHELAQQHLRVEYELRSDQTPFDSQKEIEDQTTKLDELKDKQQQYIHIKRRKSILDRFSVTSKDFAQHLQVLRDQLSILILISR